MGGTDGGGGRLPVVQVVRRSAVTARGLQVLQPVPISRGSPSRGSDGSHQVGGQPKAARHLGKQLLVRLHTGEDLAVDSAGMADLAAALARRPGLPVVDGVAAAVKLAEALVGLGLATSKRGPYAPPLPKPFTGAFAGLSAR